MPDKGVIDVVEIRTYTEADRQRMRALFARAGEGSPTESLWGHVESEAAIYLHPYLDLEPDSVLLAVGDDGELTGYLTGCLDTARFPSESKRMERAIKEYRLVFKRSTAKFFATAAFDGITGLVRRQPGAGELSDPRWPAHLHINVQPDARGTGAADGLMNTWLQKLRETGSAGCHLQTLCENTRAVRFFERMGFVKHGPTPLVPGIRYRGRRLHQQTMVWNP
ncbi:GNAT family N-acetyltransferase [Prauserella marina]|uniref:GNAT family N-acetyltransferase n=1 Tax=Prauserella marina TaxID=530584 RepID=UPI001FE26F7B|nr:GNAT family N-acetyltransferase [Prauserella marina]